MTPNWQSFAQALFARHPIVPPSPDVLAADLPASREPTITHLSVSAGREKRKFEHLRETTSLTDAWPPKQASGSK
jgi:hypothetical protein